MPYDEAVNDEILAKIRASVRKSNNGAVPQPPPVGDVRWAIAYARKGFRVFPAHRIHDDGHCSCGATGCGSKGKHPRYKGWQADATTDESVIHNWWEAEPFNIGVACGAVSDLTVLDVDGDIGRDTLRTLELEHGELPVTQMALTGSGGVHYLFRHVPGLKNEVKWAPGLDVRNDGGLIIGVGSRNDKGEYRWEVGYEPGTVERAEMPVWMADLIREAAKPTSNGSGPGMDTEEVWEGIPEGERDRKIWAYACKLRATGVPLDTAMELIRQVAARCQPPFETKLAEEKVQRAYRNYQPNGRPTPEEPPEEEPPEEVRVFTPEALYDFVDQWDAHPWPLAGILPPFSVSLIVGKSETGKSTIIYPLMRAMMQGTPFFGRQTLQGRVLYLAGDPMSEVVCGKLFRSWGLTEGFAVVPDALCMYKDGMDQLRRIMLDLKPILVVGDTLGATIKLNTDSYSDSYTAQMPIVKLVREVGTHFLGSHHSQKSAIDAYSVIDAALGSVGVAAVASTRMATRMYRRKGNKYHTFEMSNLRIGDPLIGEYVVKKYDDGSVDLMGLWKTENIALDKDLILKVLERHGPTAKRTLWMECRPKPKWDSFNDALDELLAEQRIVIEDGPRGMMLFKLRL